MATALPASSSWWPRPSSSPREPSGSSYSSDPALYSGGIPSIIRRPKTASPQGRPTLMTSVTNPMPTSSNAFTSSSKPSSSKFNLASVIGLASRSKKQQQPVDIQDPPSQIRSLPTPKSSSKQFAASSPTSNPRLSRGVASSTSGTSRASTDGPLTPAEEYTSSGARTSYQHSLMTLTDLNDPFASEPLFPDRRSSIHSDKSAKRLMQKVESRTVKTTARLPVGDGSKRRDSRDRSATLPSRVRDTPDTHLPLRSVDPTWLSSSPRGPLPSTSANLSPESYLNGQNGTMTIKGVSPTSGISRKLKNAKPAIPWPDSRPRTASGLPTHQRNGSSSSLSKENFPGGSSDVPRSVSSHSQGNTRAAGPSSTRTSISSTYTPPLPFDSRPSSMAGLSPPPPMIDTSVARLPMKPLSPSLQTPSSISTQFSRAGPRPPPMHELPPTPGIAQPSGSPTARLRPSVEHPLRARSGTVASSSAVSFTSSLSSLSFNSRPSPQEPPSAYGYPDVPAGSLSVPKGDDGSGRRGSNSGSSLVSESEGRAASSQEAASKRSQAVKQNSSTPKQSKFPLSAPRALPSPPVPTSAPPVAAPSHYTRERATSATSSTFSFGLEGGKTLRKQRSFHSSSPQAPPPQPKLRHYNSFEPPTLHSPPPPPPCELPPLPPSTPNNTGTNKRGSGGTSKETLASPRRRLFSSHKHDGKRDPGPSISNSPSDGHHPSLHHSSSWFDEVGPEPAPQPLSHDVAQHIVPPAELLRLGAVWERESENHYGVRIAKESWSSRDSDISRASSSSRVYMPPRSAGAIVRSGDSFSSVPESPPSGSKLPRSASLLSKASSAPGFTRARGACDIAFMCSNPPVSAESYTSLSPPPRRQPRMARLPSGNSAQQSQPSSSPAPSLPRRAISTAPGTTTTRVRGALIERKPSFLDMSTRRSVSIDLPATAADDDKPSFLELSRGMDSIDTIRESEGSFMQ